MKGLRVVACCAALVFASGASAGSFTDDEVRIGLMTDLSNIYSDIAGQGAVIAAEMAIEDFGGEINGHKIVLIPVDHESNGDIAKRQAQQLIKKQDVDAFAELVSSSTALPVQAIAKAQKRVTLISGAASSSLTSENCSPTGVMWAYDTYSLATGTAKAIVKQGGKTWFFLTADYSFGHQLQHDTGRVVEQAGGKVIGSANHPFKGSDFSTFLLEAKNSGAQVVALADAGGDTKHMIRQAYEFGVMEGGQQMAALLMTIMDIRELGLYVSSGLKFTVPFYWDMDKQTREWSRRFAKREGAMPTFDQASVYSSLMHYFKAIEAADTDDGPTVVKKMQELPVHDFFAKNGKLRPDGRMVHDMYLVEVKKPSESKEAWDYLRVIQTIPGDEAFRPMNEGNCPYIKK